MSEPEHNSKQWIRMPFGVSVSRRALGWLCLSRNAKKQQVCLRRVIVVVWCITVLVLVLRGLFRAPELSVCTFAKEELGLPCEEHLATTADGYQLYIKRIPRQGKPPVLLLAGLADSSATWLVSGKSESLAGQLFDNEYDVWLLEKRGRTPWRHERYNGQDMEFWDFSFDETIDKDVPAMVEYIARFTGLPIASLVGHSEGGMISVAAVAENPEVAALVQSVVGLGAPIGSWGGSGMVFPQIPDSIVQYLHPAIPLGFTRLLFTGLCAHVPSLCWSTVCAAAGCSHPSNYDPEVVSRIFSYYPRETSLKNLQHLIQCQHAGKLQRFDYGPEENLKRYNSELPRPYDFSKLATPTALFFGTKDSFVPSSDFGATASLLPENALAHVNLTLPYGHTDFIWAKDASSVLYPSVIQFIDEQTKKH